MTRSVLFDTETTGLDPATGHRLIEIAALEMIRDLPTGRHFHALVDPGREIDEDAIRVHGITAEHLAGKPAFAGIVEELLDFLEDGRLIAHNAPFDFGFLDAEFSLLGRPPLDRGRMIDTLAIARTKFPGLPNSLDALCRRFGIDLSARTSHNALLDCRLLAEVYVELTGGRQRGLSLTVAPRAAAAVTYATQGPRQPRRIVPSEADLAAHAAFVARLPDALWTRA